MPAEETLQSHGDDDADPFASLAFLRSTSLVSARFAVAVTSDQELPVGGRQVQESPRHPVDPGSPEMNRQAPERFDVRLDTTRVAIVIRCASVLGPAGGRPVLQPGGWRLLPMISVSSA